MKLALPKGTSLVTLLQFSDQGIFKQLWEEKVVNQEFGLISVSVQDDFWLTVLQKKYVIANFGNDALDFINRHPCEAERVPKDLIFPIQIGLFLQKNVKFLNLFQYELQQMHETGVVDTIIKNNDRKRESRTCGLIAELTLNFKNTVFLFVCMVLGAGASIVVFILELLYKNIYCQSKK
ncbi:uncharacterized protein LOC111712702 [Eurytemora carolleeae]|uniref:uncharacterized protein LOC111712702 n=1 Tax=Eurytemora carolleeae TaxID=1294199 RepID=UPI000C79126F|nr:uncharacterized protein LOC111712702 [Eurytemora carolleeae]|eukprot:XP_023343160.1 uncharacterized protein LOC111712702 [Eurytemora affinis]